MYNFLWRLKLFRSLLLMVVLLIAIMLPINTIAASADVSVDSLGKMILSDSNARIEVYALSSEVFAAVVVVKVSMPINYATLMNQMNQFLTGESFLEALVDENNIVKRILDREASAWSIQQNNSLNHNQMFEMTKLHVFEEAINSARGNARTAPESQFFSVSMIEQYLSFGSFDNMADPAGCFTQNKIERNGLSIEITGNFAVVNVNNNANIPSPTFKIIEQSALQQTGLSIHNEVETILKTSNSSGSVVKDNELKILRI